MNHFVVSAFVVFLFTLPAGLYFIFFGKGRSAKYFGVFWLSICFWTFFVGNQFGLLRKIPGFAWGLFLHIGCIFVPIFFLHFTLHLTGFRSRYSKWLKLAYLCGIVFILLIIFMDTFTGEIIYRDHYSYPRPQFLYPLYIILFQAIGLSTFILLLRWAKKLPQKTKMVFYLFLSTHVLAYVGSMDNYLIMYDVRIFPIYPYGLYLILPYVVFGSYAIYKLQAWREGNSSGIREKGG